MASANNPGESSSPAGPQAGESQHWVWLARLKRPQGRKGELWAEILTDFPEKFAERKQLWLLAESSAGSVASTPREAVLANHWLHKGGVVLHFLGVESINDAEKLAGLIVAIPLEQRAPLAEDETYIGDLIDCALFDVASTEPALIGEIEGVDRTAGPVPLLVVRGRDAERGDEILVPFAKSYLRKIDLASKRVEMALPAGLVDLNEA
jgi:16S rRNA processing protein RimM